MTKNQVQTTTILDLRKRFFVDLKRYSAGDIVPEADKEYQDIIANDSQGKAVGAMTLFYGAKLPCEKHLDLEELRKKNSSICEIKWLCIDPSLPDKEIGQVVIDLFAKSYSYLVEKNMKCVVISVSNRNTANLLRFERIGFGLFDSFLHPQMGKMMLVYREVTPEFDSVLKKKDSRNVLIDIGKRYLISATKHIDHGFKLLTIEMQTFLARLRQELIVFDALPHSEEEILVNLVNKTKEVFPLLNKHFLEIEKITKNLSEYDYAEHKRFYQDSLNELVMVAEVNKYIYEKPLGYAGDFIMMNYIDEYHDKYIGANSYNKLWNYYTCNLPLSKSNIERKMFFKSKIQEVIGKVPSASILSVASGPGREFIELVKEGLIAKSVSMSFFDLEPKSLEYIKANLMGHVPKNIVVNYHNDNVINLALSRNNKDIQTYDLIYASGLYDYLGDKVAGRLVNALYARLNRGGNLIICNASSQKETYRDYIELMGDWYMIYRTAQELSDLAKEIHDTYSIVFEKVGAQNNYHYMNIKKP
jgi:extracellular factor (EF) 3-hydroxypalmitic acid methyl ester biosynthesis protein